MKVRLGITEVPPRKWSKRGEPNWRETMVLNQHDSFHQIADTLCETTVKKQRKPGGLTYHTDDQIWTMEIAPYQYATKIRDPFQVSRSRRPVQVVPENVVTAWDLQNVHFHEFSDVLPCNTKIGRTLLKQGTVISFEYDQTKRFLKVLEVSH
ncbi:expressed unknown protein [Seminavis robusta]|uniref:Uncharacterized protein n=1 Tax=Seminavis robusta TaxID=568900 RepID=A0A9N8F1B6_9STRA|nr:expressed unknown protein [Seminavis robusta]|eukprot:Sro2326_g323430.1 n/a (152) ;mRNA; r:5605-6060